MTQGREISTRAIDRILYHRHEWRELIEALEPRTAGSVVTLPVSRGGGDPVGSIAVKRATVTFVLDAVDRAVRYMRRDHRRIAELRYDQERTYGEIAGQMHISLRNVERVIKLIRQKVRVTLKSLPGDIYPAFCAEIEERLADK